MTGNLLLLLMQPIARFCIRRSVKLQDLVDIFKEALVVAARQELARQNEKITGSRLSVMTGVHRKDIKQFIEGKESKPISNVITRVVGQWGQDRRFRTRAGKPRVLTVEGADSEFASLVTSVSVDLNPYTVLFELERIGAVARTPRGLKLVVNFYFPEDDLEGAYQLLASDLDDLIRSVEENIHEKPELHHLHLKTEYDKIPKADIPRLKDWLLKEGSSFHDRVRKYVSKHDADVNRSADAHAEYGRLSIGTFGYSEYEKDI